MSEATATLKTEIVPQESPQAVATLQRDSSMEASPEWRQVLREAEKLACASLCPTHLKVPMPPADGTPATENRRRGAWNQMLGNCILVANQARKWGADTFAVAAESYVVGNKLGYQGKLIAAVVNARAGLSEPLQALYSTSKGDDFAAVIYGSEDAITGDERKKMFALLKRYADQSDQEANRDLAELGVLTVRVSVGQCKTDNKMWRTDPEQKLFYTGCTKWARRHKPELMLGILSDDDLDYMKMQERREHQAAQQSRIDMVIPAALDASGVLPPPTTPPESVNSNGNGNALEVDEGNANAQAPTETTETAAPAAETKPAEQQPTNGDGFDADTWTEEFVAWLPKVRGPKGKRETEDTLRTNRAKIGEDRYQRCRKAMLDLGWTLSE